LSNSEVYVQAAARKTDIDRGLRSTDHDTVLPCP